MSLEDTIETTLNQIQKVMGANSIVGTEIITDDKVIIPISKVALGFGVGVYDNQKDSETRTKLYTKSLCGFCCRNLCKIEKFTAFNTLIKNALRKKCIFYYSKSEYSEALYLVL